jgi:hypothetical protein
MSFSAFSSFLHKLAFQHFKSQLKSSPFISVFDFSAFRLKKSAKKQKQTWPYWTATLDRVIESSVGRTTVLSKS